MKIRLSEIPEEGRHYTFDQKTGELNEALKDLVGERDYSVEFDIRPMGNVYEIAGQVKTTLIETCSKCGWDLELGLARKFREILMEEMKDKDAKIAGHHTLNLAEEKFEISEYRNDHLELDGLVHQAIAEGIEEYPSCGKDDCEHLLEAQLVQQRLAEEFESAEAEKKGHPGFQVLEQIFKRKN